MWLLLAMTIFSTDNVSTTVLRVYTAEENCKYAAYSLRGGADPGAYPVKYYCEKIEEKG